MRAPKRLPAWNDVVDGLSGNKTLVTAITGHLIIEALLVELLKIRYEEKFAWKLSFVQKVDLCIKERYLSASARRSYLLLNGIRNDYAHRLHEQKKYAEFEEVAREVLRGLHHLDDGFVKRPVRKLGRSSKTLLEWCVLNLYHELAEALSAQGQHEYMP